MIKKNVAATVEIRPAEFTTVRQASNAIGKERERKREREHQQQS